MDRINSFMQTAEAVGGVFFWVVLMAGLFLGIWKLLKWLHQEGQYTHFSLVEVVGDLIWLGMFVLPAITIGAYVGGIIDNVLQIDYGLNCAFFAGGLVVGFYLWLRSNSQ